jgi:hypothetical protein
VVGITWLNRQIFKSFGVLKEMDLALTAFLTLVNLEENIGFFVVSCFIYMFHAIYIVRKEIKYASSFANYVGFRFLVILNYSANITFIHIQNITAFNFFYSMIAVVVLIWYIRSAHNLFHHELLRKIYLTVNALFLTLYISCFQNLVLQDEIQKQIVEISKLLLIFLVFIFLFSFLLNTS